MYSRELSIAEILASVSILITWWLGKGSRIHDMLGGGASCFASMEILP